MPVLQKLFHRGALSVPFASGPAPPNRATEPERSAAVPEAQAYDEADVPDLQVTGSPPGWAPECGTPTFSTLHHHPS